MLDMTQTVVPKSDQLNANDMIAGPMQIKVSAVKIIGGEQPVHISYEGDNGKPWKPCKSMCRVMILAWGKDGEAYVGRSMVIYRDPSVKWAGKEQGGIRISHMSDIKDKLRMMLTVSRGKRIPFVVEPLQVQQGTPLTQEALNKWAQDIFAAETMEQLSDIGALIKTFNYEESGANAIRDIYQKMVNKIRGEE